MFFLPWVFFTHELRDGLVPLSLKNPVLEVPSLELTTSHDSERKVPMFSFPGPFLKERKTTVSISVHVKSTSCPPSAAETRSKPAKPPSHLVGMCKSLALLHTT